MSVSYNGLVIVIPTRNRGDLARTAIDSVLGQPGTEIQVLVSDNSTTPVHRTSLRQYCTEGALRRVRYVTPPEILPMATHWEWAMQQALSLYDASHFAFLSDRMLFKPGASKPLLEITTAYPDKILCYMHDMVDDFSEPVVLHQYTWTGKLYEVPSTRLLELVSQSVVYDTSMPRMLNCVVPRSILNAIERRFGDIFTFNAPDWSFCFRALEVVDSLLFHDRAALVHYAQDRSSGQSAHFGVANDAFDNFMQNLRELPVNFAAPFPEIITVWNAIISEYCHAKETTQSAKFPGLNLDRYEEALASGIDKIMDPQRREEMRGFLTARQRKRQDMASTPAQPRSTVTETAQTAPPETQVPPVEEFSVNALEFKGREAALQHALRCPRERIAACTHTTFIQAVEVPWPVSETKQSGCEEMNEEFVEPKPSREPC